MATCAPLVFCSIGLAAQHNVAPTPPPIPAPRRPTVLVGRKGKPVGGAAGMPAGMMPNRQQMAGGPAQPEMPEDGTPVFYLYCRNPKSKVMWYPVSMMRGDGQSKGLVGAWVNSPFAKGVFKDRLDEGMARSIYESERRLTEMARQQYPSLKKLRELEWGYKVMDKEIMAKVAAKEMDEPKTQVVNKAMFEESFLEKAKRAVGA